MKSYMEHFQKVLTDTDCIITLPYLHKCLYIKVITLWFAGLELRLSSMFLNTLVLGCSLEVHLLPFVLPHTLTSARNLT